jgi:hypothetical protein
MAFWSAPECLTNKSYGVLEQEEQYSANQRVMVSVVTTRTRTKWQLPARLANQPARVLRLCTEVDLFGIMASVLDTV